MKILRNLAAVLFASVLSTSAFAAKYQCGIWLDSTEEPAAKFDFDSEVGEASARANDKFAGAVKKQDNGAVLIGTIASDKTVSLALYPENAEIMLSFLSLADGKRAATACTTGSTLTRPATSF